MCVYYTHTPRESTELHIIKRLKRKPKKLLAICPKRSLNKHLGFIPFSRFYMSCSKAPLTSTTTAAHVQLAQSHTTHHSASFTQQKQEESISLPTTTTTPTCQSENESEDEEEEEEEIEMAGPVKRMPMLVPDCTTPYSAISIAKALSSASSPPALGKTPLDKNPLWLQNPVLPASNNSTSNSSNPLFIPTSSLSASLAGKTVILPKSTAVTSAQSVPMMYKLMSPSCMPRSLLAPVLTVLPSPTNTVTPPSSMFLAKHMAAGNQTMPFQPVIMSTATNPTQSPVAFDDAIVKSTKQVVIPEPATGQTVFPQQQELSPVSSTTPQLSSSPQPRTLASIPPSELTPQHVELKAFAEDFKTRRIRLGFTQGAVGQSLAERGFNNFAQSTISRFEQMQLSPANAATIRVILEKWLVEAECPESASIMNDNNNGQLPQMAGRKRKKRAVFTTQTRSILDEFFTQNPRPNRQTIENISQKLDLLPEEVRVWFCNKRQKSKTGGSGGHRISFDRESSHSTTSSGAPSPTPSEGGMSQKRWSPSPPKTPFTIEALSKSSVMSAIPSTAQMSTSTVPSLGIVASVTHSTNMPLLFSGSQLFGNPILPQFIAPRQISKTQA